MCYKCNKRGSRPTQSYFKCMNPACGVRNNADFNGAMNIAKRLVRKLKLSPEKLWGKTGLGRFLPENTPKASSSKRRTGRPGTAKGATHAPVPVRVVRDSISSNDSAMLKSKEKPALRDCEDPRNQSGKKQPPSREGTHTSSLPRDDDQVTEMCSSAELTRID